MAEIDVSGQNPTTTILLLTHPRTACHVLERMLSKQPNTAYGADWFILARAKQLDLVLTGPIQKAEPDLQDEVHTLFEQAFSEFTEFLENTSRQGELAFAHVLSHTVMSPKVNSDYLHGASSDSQAAKLASAQRWMVGRKWCEDNEKDTICTSPLVLPDAVLLRPGTVPILTVRHPMLVYEALYRAIFKGVHTTHAAAHQLMILRCTFRWQREIYEWYLEHGAQIGIEPIVLEADDYLGPEKESLMQKLCERVPGLQLESVIYNWPKATDEDVAALPEVLQEVHRTILGSECVMPGYDTRGRDIDTEMAMWGEKYGLEEAKFIRELVDKSMPDYEYLKERRLRP